MYDINAGNARPEMAEVGKGSNQLADYRPVERAIENKAAIQERAAAAKAKKEEERAADIQAQIAGMKTGDIMPHDKDLVKEKLQAMRDYAVKNADKLRAGDMEAQMGFDAVKNDAGILIANSIDKKNNYAASTKMYSEHPENFTPESRDNLYKFAGSEYAGQEFNPSLYLQEGTNLIDDAHKNLLPLIQNAAKGGTYEVPLAGGGTHKIVYNKTLDRDIKDPKTGEITQVGLESFLRDNLLNRRVFNTASSQFNQLTDEQKQKYKNEQGEPDVAEYYIKTMTPKLRIAQGENITSAGWKPTEGEGAGGEKQPKVNMTFTKYGKGDWRGTLEYTKAPDNPYQAQTVLDPATGEFIQANVKPQAIVSKGGNQWIEAITQPTVDESGAKVPPKIVQIPYDAGGKEMLHDKFGIDNVFDIEASGGKKKPENIKLNYQDISKAGQERSPETGAIKMAAPKAVEMSDADKQALNWANANPSDKRAQVIKDKLKAKGIK
jgi:hypothetical protein